MTVTESPAHAPVSELTELTVDALVDATPANRDRYVDLLRALSIAVVILWHWVFSVTHWNDDGALTMPNPIGDVGLMWLATWLLQIMPVFFIVGGFANLAGYEALERAGRPSWVGFARQRLERLLRPVAAFVAVWAVADTALRLAVGGYDGVLTYGRVVFVPLWFLGVCTGVVLLAPLEEPSALWWAQRPLWLIAPGLVLSVSWPCSPGWSCPDVALDRREPARPAVQMPRAMLANLV
jgi:hypothetical protein